MPPLYGGADYDVASARLYFISHIYVAHHVVEIIDLSDGKGGRVPYFRIVAQKHRFARMADHVVAHRIFVFVYVPRVAVFVDGVRRKKANIGVYVVDKAFGKGADKNGLVVFVHHAARRIRLYVVLGKKRERVYAVCKDFYVVVLGEVLSDKICRRRPVEKNHIPVFNKFSSL